MAQWSVILSVSANSMEVAALGAEGTTEPQQWLQWMQESEARAELPLGPGNRDTNVNPLKLLPLQYRLLIDWKTGL